MKTYQDFCQTHVKTLFQLIDTHGSLLKWKKEWHVEGAKTLPHNKNGLYRGINLTRLLTAQIELGWTSPYWLTFRQVQQLGAHVLKGAKGTKVCFWKLLNDENQETPNDDDASDNKIIPLFKTYTVFNLDQTSLSEDMDTLELPTLSTMPVADWLATLDFSLSHFGKQPHYKGEENVIVIPKKNYFNRIEDYFITLLHEIIHWTGHMTRLNRTSFKRYGEVVYRAEEELVAEIGSVLLASYFNLNGDLLNHASYVASWKQHLDEKAIARASSQAAKAFHWLIEKRETVSEKVVL